MLTTFGATFFGVISSFLLWYVGQWWLKRGKDRIAVKHMLQETNEEIAININILNLLVQSIPKTIAGGNIPVYLPFRMQLSVYNYLTSSGALRLLNASKRSTIASAGMISESFNKFVENSELLLTTNMGLPNSLTIAKYRLEGLAEQAQDTAKGLNAILETLNNEPK